MSQPGNHKLNPDLNPASTHAMKPRSLFTLLAKKRNPCISACLIVCVTPTRCSSHICSGARRASTITSLSISGHAGKTSRSRKFGTCIRMLPTWKPLGFHFQNYNPTTVVGWNMRSIFFCGSFDPNVNR